MYWNGSLRWMANSASLLTKLLPGSSSHQPVLASLWCLQDHLPWEGIWWLVESGPTHSANWYCHQYFWIHTPRESWSLGLWLFHCTQRLCWWCSQCQKHECQSRRETNSNARHHYSSQQLPTFSRQTWHSWGYPVHGLPSWSLWPQACRETKGNVTGSSQVQVSVGRTWAKTCREDDHQEVWVLSEVTEEERCWKADCKGRGDGPGGHNQWRRLSRCCTQCWRTHGWVVLHDSCPLPPARLCWQKATDSTPPQKLWPQVHFLTKIPLWAQSHWVCLGICKILWVFRSTSHLLP